LGGGGGKAHFLITGVYDATAAHPVLSLLAHHSRTLPVPHPLVWPTVVRVAFCARAAVITSLCFNAFRVIVVVIIIIIIISCSADPSVDGGIAGARVGGKHLRA
jgi:hypothetical protein